MGYCSRQIKTNGLQLRMIITFNEDHNSARFLQFVDQVLERVSTDDAFTFCLIGKEFIHFRRSSIVGTNDEAVIGHVHYQILAHHRQTNQTDIRSRKIAQHKNSFIRFCVSKHGEAEKKKERAFDLK